MDNNPFWPWDPGTIALEVEENIDYRKCKVTVTFPSWPSIVLRWTLDFDRLIMEAGWSEAQYLRLIHQGMVREFWRMPIPPIPDNIILSDN